MNSLSIYIFYMVVVYQIWQSDVHFLCPLVVKIITKCTLHYTEITYQIVLFKIAGHFQTKKLCIVSLTVLTYLTGSCFWHSTEAPLQSSKILQLQTHAHFTCSNGNIGADASIGPTYISITCGHTYADRPKSKNNKHYE